MAEFMGFLKRNRKVGTTKARRLSTFIGSGMEAGSPFLARRGEALASLAYRDNPIAYRAASLIAQSAASLPWLLSVDGQPYTNHPLLDCLSHPNPKQSGQRLREALFSHLILTGNAYLHALVVDGDIVELSVLPPERVIIQRSGQSFVEGYSYHPGGQRLFYPAEGDPIQPICHLALFNPNDEVYGQSPLEAARYSLEIHQAATEWNQSLLARAATPSGALIYQGGTGRLSESQFSRLKSELEDNFQGRLNAGRPLLLEGGLEWRQLSLSPKDMDFLEMRNAAAREIALALGVPPMLLGLPGDNTYANYREANRALWRETVLPLADRLARTLETWFAPLYGKSLNLEVDRDYIDALAEEREKLWSQLEAASFLTDDEKRAMLGFSPRSAVAE